MDSMAVIVTCVNPNDPTDIDPSIEGFYNSLEDALEVVNDFTINKCKNSTVYEHLIQYFENEKNISRESAVKYVDKTYVMTPLIVGLPNKTDFTLH
jgi:hypothetical protein